MYNNSNKKIDNVLLASIIIFASAWGLLIFDKTAMVSEGWYVVYAKLILAGKVPYRDFELMFPPLYTYFNAICISIFGESLITFRIIGVLLFVGLAVLAFYTYKLIFPSLISAIAAITTVFVAQSEIVNIMYDYGRFFDLFNNLSFFLMLRVIVKLYKKQKINTNLNFFVAGITSGVAFLFRQSSGLIVIAYFIAIFVLIKYLIKDIKITNTNIWMFAMGVVLPNLILIVLLALNGALMPFINMTLLTDSKGSFTAVLFNWIPRWLSNNASSAYIVFATAIIAIFLIRNMLNQTSQINKKSDLLTYLVLIFGGIITMIIMVYFPASTKFFPFKYGSLVGMMFTLNFILAIWLLIRIIIKLKDKQEIGGYELAIIFMNGFIFAVGFGCGTSYSLALGQGAMNFGFIVGLVLVQVFKQNINELYRKSALALSFILILGTVAYKASVPYNWLGLMSKTYASSKYETDIPYFRGIKMPLEDKEMYEDFIQKTSLYLGENDTLYCYSQISIFYSLADKLPQVQAVVPWIDVSRDVTLKQDLEYLKANKPKMIVLADHGLDYIISAEGAFRQGNKSGQRMMYEWICELMQGEYDILSEYEVQNYKIYLLIRN